MSQGDTGSPNFQEAPAELTLSRAQRDSHRAQWEEVVAPLFPGLREKIDPGNQLPVGDNDPNRYGVRVTVEILGKDVLLANTGVGLRTSREDFANALGAGRYKIEAYYRNPSTGNYSKYIQSATVMIDEEETLPRRHWDVDTSRTHNATIYEALRIHNEDAKQDALDEIDGGGGDRDDGRRDDEDDRDGRGRDNGRGRDRGRGYDDRGGGQDQRRGNNDPRNADRCPQGCVIQDGTNAIMLETACPSGCMVWSPKTRAWGLHVNPEEKKPELAKVADSITDKATSLLKDAGGIAGILALWKELNSDRDAARREELETRKAEAEAKKAEAAAKAITDAAKIKAESDERIAAMKQQADEAQRRSDAQFQQLQALTAKPAGPSIETMMAQMKADQLERDNKRDKEIADERRERDNKDADRRIKDLEAKIDGAKKSGSPFDEFVNQIKSIEKAKESLGIKKKDEDDVGGFAANVAAGFAKDPAGSLKGVTEILGSIGGVLTDSSDGRVKEMEAQNRLLIAQLALEQQKNNPTPPSQGPQIQGASVRQIQSAPAMPTESLPPTANGNDSGMG